mmetsp:Transcript_78016/g.137621  ORF Transcript_78016/g.137621 Transcript_78016/m.137621 type:complete len:213 (-) Transcript_78016:319-957(-)
MGKGLPKVPQGCACPRTVWYNCCSLSGILSRLNRTQVAAKANAKAAQVPRAAYSRGRRLCAISDCSWSQQACEWWASSGSGHAGQSSGRPVVLAPVQGLVQLDSKPEQWRSCCRSHSSVGCWTTMVVQRRLTHPLTRSDSIARASVIITVVTARTRTTSSSRCTASSQRWASRAARQPNRANPKVARPKTMMPMAKRSLTAPTRRCVWCCPS